MIKKFYPLVFFTCAAVLVFWKVLFHPEFTLLTGADTAAAYYPWFDVASYWLKRGVLLLWDPYVYAGKMTMGEPQPGIFYPLNWIFMLLPSSSGGVNVSGLQALFIIDYLLAGLFTYQLARSLGMSRPAASAAGLAYAYGGYMAPLYGYLNVLSGFVWMPLALYFFRRAVCGADWIIRLRNVAGSGSCVALAFLPGHHIPAIHTGFLLLLYAVFAVVARGPGPRWHDALRGAVLLSLTAATSVGLTAFQWLPSAAWARAAFRWVGFGPPLRWGQKVPYSILEKTSNISPQDGLSLVLPYASTGANMYTGAVVIFLALVALLFARKREPLFFGFACLFYFFLSWGRISVLHGWVNSLVPGLWFARELFYYLVPLQFCLALLAGWGLDRITSASPAEERSLMRFLRNASWAMAGVILFAGCLITALSFHKELPMAHPFITALAGLASYLFVLGLLLFLSRTGRISPRVFAGTLVSLVLVDLGSHFAADIRMKSPPESQENTYVRSFWMMPPAAERLKRMRQQEFFRVDDPSGLFPPNYGDAWRLDATMGHGATALVDYLDFRGTGWGPFSNASALLNVRYIPSRIPIPGMERLPDYPIYRNPRAVQRAFVPSRYRCFGRPEELLNWLASPLFDPRQTALFLCSALDRVPSDFRQPRWREDEGIEVRVLHRRTAGERAAEALPPEQRTEFLKYQPPPGWGAGDEITLRLKPSEEGRYFLAMSYLPTDLDKSRLRVLLEGGGEQRETMAELPGPAEQQGWLDAKVDLGLLGRHDYTLSIHKDEQCTAALDSFRLTRSSLQAGQEQAGQAAVTSMTPNMVVVNARMNRPGFVVLSEVNYPGWEASIDGNPAPILTADHILRAVPVAAGEHQVELRFRPAPFRWGLWVSAVCLILMTGFLWRTRPSVSSPHPDRGIDPDPGRG
jgi:hypothetical protein